MTTGTLNSWSNLNVTGRVDVDELTVGGLPVTAGNVASVSVVTANGISGTVANPTTTPAITLALGDIAPTGNLTMATGKNIMGDWSNGTFTNRTKIMTSTTNSVTRMEITPNGTATETKVNLENASDLTNSSLFQMGINASRALVLSAVNGTGTVLPIYVQCGSANPVGLSLTTDGGVVLGGAAKKVGFYGNAGATQAAAIADATDGTDVITNLNLLLAAARALGLIASA
jgi:hypothetical protein